MQYKILSKQKRMRVVNLWEEDGACWMVFWGLVTTLPVDMSGMRSTDVTLVSQISDWKALEMATSWLWGCNNGSEF